MRRITLTALVALCLSGCGAGTAKVKGRLVENGKPRTFSANSAAVEFTLLDADDKPVAGKTFTAVVNSDGAFEVVASGGEVPPGTYMVGVTLRGELQKKYPSLAPPKSAVRRKVVAGKNDFTIDLAKPDE